MDTGDAEAEVEPEAERESEEPVSAPSGLTKRKRSLNNEDANDSSLETPEAAEDTASPQSRLAAARGKIHGLAGVKGVILGYWRDSPPEDPAEKHAVIGFIDVRDRYVLERSPPPPKSYLCVHADPRLLPLASVRASSRLRVKVFQSATSTRFHQARVEAGSPLSESPSMII